MRSALLVRVDLVSTGSEDADHLIRMKIDGFIDPEIVVESTLGDNHTPDAVWTSYFNRLQVDVASRMIQA